MKITSIRAVSVNIPRTPPQSTARRPNWNTHAQRALPINKYPEFSRLHGQMPGANTRADVWVQVIAEDGTWGLGQCSFGEPVAVLVDYHFAPRRVGVVDAREMAKVPWAWHGRTSHHISVTF